MDYTNADIEAALRRTFEEIGNPFTSERYDTYVLERRSRGEAIPTSSVVRRRLGRWDAVFNLLHDDAKPAT